MPVIVSSRQASLPVAVDPSDCFPAWDCSSRARESSMSPLVGSEGLIGYRFGGPGGCFFIRTAKTSSPSPIRAVARSKRIEATVWLYLIVDSASGGYDALNGPPRASAQKKNATGVTAT